MSLKNITLSRPISAMDGVNGLFAQVLGGVQIPIFAPEAYPTVLQEIRSDLKLFNTSKGRYDFQNLGVVNAEAVNYLRMAEFHYSMAARGYPAMINISPLGWVSRLTGLPIFGVLEVKSQSLFSRRNPKASIFTLSVDVEHSSFEGTRVTFHPNIPDEMKDLYLPAARTLEQACVENLGRGNTIFISTEFAGEMPIPLEKYIKTVEKSRVFDSLWVIFQAPEWKIGHSVLVQKDPIIVGRIVHRFLGPQHFFLGIFDPTKYEQDVAENYTHGPQFLLKN